MKMNQMLRGGLVLCVAFLLCVQTGFAAEEVTVQDTMQKALQFSPRLKVLKNNRDAIGYDLRQAKGGYFPRVDAVLGYGTEQHSSAATRVDGNDPGNEEWESRGEASVTLTQMLYDGGEVSGSVAAQKARFDSANNRVFDNAETLALDAIIAHLNVYRQRQLLALAEKNVESHQEILGSLEERQRAGAGSTADVAQTRGRLARSMSTKLQTEADLKAAIANYERVVGVTPGNLVDATMPETVPPSLEEAVDNVRQNNPKIKASSADTAEAIARQKVATSAFFPKVNLELGSSYDDQVEGDASYQWTNSAMVRARWNLFNGGSDYAGRKAAIARKHQAIESRNNQAIEVIEEARATWAQLEAARARVDAFTEAVSFNEETRDSYLQQFNVAQRSLLDVLDAENELFQTSGLLVTEKVNKLIAAYRLLALEGSLEKSIN